MAISERATVAYRRVSTGEQADSGLGLEAQARKIEALGLLHDAPAMRDYVDAGASARSITGRPELERLLADIRAGAVGAVYVAKLDRLTRNLRDLGMLIDLVNKHDVRLVSAGESVDTGTAAGRLVLHVLGAVAEWERDAISERTVAALAALKSQGKRAGTVPFGFRAGDDGVLVKDDAEQQIRLTAQTYRALGNSLRAIARKLNDAGYRTRRGGLWSAQGVKASLLQVAGEKS